MPPLSKTGPLGRSLGNLMDGLPDHIASAATLSTSGFMRLSPDRIRLPPSRENAADSLPDSFLDSIREHGILQPILVRKTDDGYEVIAGARRLAAARRVRLEDVPVMVVQAGEETAAVFSRVENTERLHAAPPAARGTPTGHATESHVTWRFASGMVAICALVACAIWLGWSLSEQKTAPGPQVALPRRDLPPPRPPPPSAPPLEKHPVIALEEFRSLPTEQVTVEEHGTDVRILFQAPVFSSFCTLDDSRRDILKQIGALLARHEGKCSVLITGHTDATPIRHSSAYRDNRDLGLARAAETARFLWQEAGVPSSMLTIATAGSDSPPFPPDTPAAARRNRTVTLLVMPTR